MIKKKKIKKKKYNLLNNNILSIFKSNKNYYFYIYSILFDSIIFSISTSNINLKDFLFLNFGINLKFSLFAFMGKLIAEKTLSMGINKVSFNRSSYKYHGHIKTFVYFSRKYGLIF